MDYTVLYMILAAGVAFGIAYVVSYLRKKDLVGKENLLFAIKILDLSMKVVNELNLEKEEFIADIAIIVRDSLEYAISLYNDEQRILENAYDYAIDLCLALEIELTDNRKDIIRELVHIAFSNYYKNLIN